MNFNNCINLLNVIIPTFPSEIEKKTPKDIFQKNRVTACLQNAIKQSPSHLKDEVEQLNKKWGTFCSKVLDTEQIPENAQKKLKKLKELISTIYHKHTVRAANQSSPNHSTPNPSSPNHSSPEDLVLNFQRTGTKALLAHKFPTTMQYLGRIFKKLKQKEYGETLHEEYNSLSPLVTTQESLLKFVLFELALDAKDQNGETLQNQQNFFNTFLPELWKLSNDQKIHLISLINMLKDISLETFEKILIGKEESVITKYMNDLTAQAEIKRIEFNELVSLCSSDENINQYITRQTHNNIPHSLWRGYFPQSTVTLWLPSRIFNHLNNNNSIPLERQVEQEVEQEVERQVEQVPRLPENVFRDILMPFWDIPTSLEELSKKARIVDAVQILWQRSMTHHFPITFLQEYLNDLMRESSREEDPEFLLDIPTMEKIINALLKVVSSNFNHSSINNNSINLEEVD